MPMTVLELSTLSFLSAIPTLYLLPFSTYFSTQILMPVPERQKVGQWVEKFKKTSLKKAAANFIPLFSKRLSPSLFCLVVLAKNIYLIKLLISTLGH